MLWKFSFWAIAPTSLAMFARKAGYAKRVSKIWLHHLIGHVILPQRANFHPISTRNERVIPTNSGKPARGGFLCCGILRLGQTAYRLENFEGPLVMYHLRVSDVKVYSVNCAEHHKRREIRESKGQSSTKAYLVSTSPTTKAGKCNVPLKLNIAPLWYEEWDCQWRVVRGSHLRVKRFPC